MQSTDTDAQHQIWQFAEGVTALGLRRNISFGNTVNIPSDVSGETVRVYKHASGRGVVTVWPVGGDQADEVERLAAENDLAELRRKLLH